MTIGILIFSLPCVQEHHTGSDRLEESIRLLGHEAVRIHEPLLLFSSHGNQGEIEILHDGKPLPALDVIISRPNFVQEPSLRTYAVEILRQSEYRVINGSPAFAWTKNKLTQHVMFAHHNLPCPRWAIARSPEAAVQAAEKIGWPVILKIAFGTHGKGVFFAENARTFQPIAEYLAVRDSNPLIIEEFIAEAQEKDLRIFVVGDEVVAGMERIAPEQDVRANASNGGVGRPVALTREEEDLAVRAARIFRLELAGIDIIRSHHGPLLLEVNSNPGFKELEKATGVDVANAIVSYALSQCAESSCFPSGGSRVSSKKVYDHFKQEF